MTEQSPGFFWPLRPPVYVAAGALVFAVALAGVWGMADWPYQEWPYTSALFHQRLDLAGPVAAFFSAYISGRLTPPSRLFALPKFQRDRARYLLRSLAPLSAVVTAGYLGALIPIVILTALRATHGSLDVAVAASGLVALQVYLMLGWLLGLAARSAFVAPVAFALGVVTSAAGYSGDTFAAVAPVLYITPTLGFHESTPMVAFRIAFLVTVILVAGLTAVRMLDTRQFRRTGPSLRSSAVWLVPLALTAAGVVRTPALFAGDRTLPAACRQISGLQLCVHLGHRTQLEPLARTVGPVLARSGTQHLPFDRIHDRALAGPRVRPDDQHTYYYDLSPTVAINSNVTDMARIAAGSTRCTGGANLNAPNEFIINMRRLGDRLAGTTRNADMNPFSALSDTEVRAWVDRHRQQVSTCTIDDSLLP